MKKYSKYIIFTSIIISLFLSIYIYVANHNDIKDNYESSIGGDFKLLNQDNKIVTNNTYIGKYVMVYFGFSRCKQICPFHLNIMQEALEKIKSDKLMGLFVTVDPYYDSVEVLKKYHEVYDGRIEMLTGNIDDILSIRNKYRVSVMENKEDPEELNHSVFIYIIAPNGKVIAFKAVEDSNDLISFLKSNIR